MKRWSFVVILVLVAAAVVFLLQNPLSESEVGKDLSRTIGSEVGNTAPSFTLTSFDGEDISLENFRGKPVIVKFWASHCGACNLTAPALTSFYNDNKDSISIIAINIDTSETPEAIDEYLNKHEITYLAGMDQTGEIVQDYRVVKTSTYFFLDANGVITQKHSLVILDKSLFQLGYEKALANAS